MSNTPLLGLHDLFCQEALALNYRPSTIQWWKRSIKMFLSHYKRENYKDISDLTPERLRMYLYSKRLNKRWTADTFSNQYRGLKAFLKWCVKHKYLANDPLDGIERPRLEKKLPKRVSLQDAERVLEYAFHAPYPYRFLRYRNRAIMAVLLYAGLRASELLKLKLADVDLVNETLLVECGKGAKDRLIPLNETLVNYLAEYLVDRNRVGKGGVYFFTTLQGNGPLTYTGLRRLVERIRRGTGIHFSPHRLRHTFATLMLEGECDIFGLQKLMGHSDVRTTTIYLSASLDHLRAQIAKHPMSVRTQQPQTLGLARPSVL